MHKHRQVICYQTNSPEDQRKNKPWKRTLETACKQPDEEQQKVYTNINTQMTIEPNLRLSFILSSTS